MLKACWVITLLLASFAALLVINVFMGGANGAPQEAALAAIACALCIVPYVFTRAVEGFQQQSHTPVENGKMVQSWARRKTPVTAAVSTPKDPPTP